MTRPSISSWGILQRRVSLFLRYTLSTVTMSALEAFLRCDPIFADDTAELVRKGAPAIGTDIFDGTGDHDSEIHRM